ncbi:hypothetical protein CA13_16160 [Planctomycetes bacterium CA13]|uniref:Uncharacterized protein n=1 Tax=Novipirellula herctigrandis TaxID=2527986 RepID=A0A5C5Z0I5_9BACT|nr:hypothetical protein CA13_16160 [Planctomycetes bacterium CA13]
MGEFDGWASSMDGRVRWMGEFDGWTSSMDGRVAAANSLALCGGFRLLLVAVAVRRGAA